jgi:hypothetical protein
MVAAEIQRLGQTISHCIAIRGIYALLDDRLDLICGRNARRRIDSAEVKQRIAEFAAEHGWAFTRYQEGFIFWPDSSSAPVVSVPSGEASGPSA